MPIMSLPTSVERLGSIPIKSGSTDIMPAATFNAIPRQHEEDHHRRRAHAADAEHDDGHDRVDDQRDIGGKVDQVVEEGPERSGYRPIRNPSTDPMTTAMVQPITVRQKLSRKLVSTAPSPGELTPSAVRPSTATAARRAPFGTRRRPRVAMKVADSRQRVRLCCEESAGRRRECH